MPSPTPPDYSHLALTLSAISIGISAILGGIRVFEFVGDLRHGLSATMMYRGTPEGRDDDLLIMNGGRRPTNIYYYFLFWAKPSSLGKWYFEGLRLLREEYGSDDTFENFTIQSGGQHVINFSNARAIGKRPEDGAELVLKLFVVGRKRPIWIWVN